MRRPESPEDFHVEEVPLYPPSGEGEHTFVRVEKRLRTTEEVARELARAGGVPRGAVGYAGRKDRVAVATQWFSVPGLDPARALALELAGARVLEAARHRHKLRTGHLRANRFRIVVRDVPDAVFDAARARLPRLARLGLPNRFGEQRFGRDSDNAERGLALLRGASRVRDRREARFLLSALQARIFNATLDAREAPLDALELGDVAVVHASGGLFAVADPVAEAPRAQRFEVSATGPIWGSRPGPPQPAHRVAERERRVLEAHDLVADAWRAPRGVRLRGGRRALRVRPEALALAREGAAHAALCVTLPPGSYATVLLDALFGPDDGGFGDSRAGGGLSWDVAPGGPTR